MKKAVKTAKKAAPKAKAAVSPAKQIDAKIAALGDWRGATLARVRAIILAADAQIIETVKWGGVPVWEQGGIICTGETYKDKVKLTFAKGAALDDPAGLFNSSLDGAVRRAIDIGAGEKINEKALKTLVRAGLGLINERTAQSVVCLGCAPHRSPRVGAKGREGGRREEYWRPRQTWSASVVIETGALIFSEEPEATPAVASSLDAIDMSMVWSQVSA